MLSAKKDAGGHRMAIYGIWTRHSGADTWGYSGRTFPTQTKAKKGLKKYKSSIKKMGVNMKWMEFKIS